MPPVSEVIVKVTPQQFETMRSILHRGREFAYGICDYAAAVTALRSIGIEPVDNVTYRFEIVKD